jgi:lipopolysaccharide/colanic/teichoic acid biosynthesis glycosyltransferase
MNGRSLRFVEAALEPLQVSTAVPLQRKAVVYEWNPTSSYLVSALHRAFSFRYVIVKRTIDIILSLVLLVLFFPVGLTLGLVVMLTSRGPIFYCEEREGRFRVPFRIYKFRSMYICRQRPKVFHIRDGQVRDGHVANPQPARENKCAGDPRITPVGRVLRRISLDELPQLWNVLKGDMSLVGPRPIVNKERRLYGNKLPYYDLFRPGITGLWQVSGRSDLDYDERVRLDCEYAACWSCFFDLAILVRTIPAVISMRGAY